MMLDDHDHGNVHWKFLRFENQLHLDQRRVGSVALINLPQENSQERPLLQTPCSGNCRIFGQLLSTAPSTTQPKKNTRHALISGRLLCDTSVMLRFTAQCKACQKKDQHYQCTVSKNDGDLLHSQYRFTSSSSITSLFFKNNIPSSFVTITFQ